MIPFGLLFEEKCTTESDQIEPIYDPMLGLSIIKKDDGTSVPFISWSDTKVFASNTGTATKASGDPDNDDTDYMPTPTYSFEGTKTVTAVAHEVTDAD